MAFAEVEIAAYRNISPFNSCFIAPSALTANMSIV